MTRNHSVRKIVQYPEVAGYKSESWGMSFTAQISGCRVLYTEEKSSNSSLAVVSGAAYGVDDE